MNPQQTQPNEQLTPDEAKASLGIATALQSKLIPKGAQMPQDGEQPQDMANDPNTKIEALETQFKDFQKEIKDMIKEQIGGLTKELKDALKDDENE